MCLHVAGLIPFDEGGQGGVKIGINFRTGLKLGAMGRREEVSSPAKGSGSSDWSNGRVRWSLAY